jgi:hypothetical protein
MTHLGYYFLATDISLAANMSCGHALATLPRWEPVTVVSSGDKKLRSFTGPLGMLQVLGSVGYFISS